MGARRRHSREFKLEAVRLAGTGDRSVSEVAEGLGISTALLHKWMRALKSTARPDEAFPGNGKLTSTDEEVRRLRRELARVTEERDILKKATTYFARLSK